MIIYSYSLTSTWHFRLVYWVLSSKNPSFPSLLPGLIISPRRYVNTKQCGILFHLNTSFDVKGYEERSQVKAENYVIQTSDRQTTGYPLFEGGSTITQYNRDKWQISSVQPNQNNYHVTYLFFLQITSLSCPDLPSTSRSSLFIIQVVCITVQPEALVYLLSSFSH